MESEAFFQKWLQFLHERARQISWPSVQKLLHRFTSNWKCQLKGEGKKSGKIHPLGGHECLYKFPCQSIQYLLSYFSLDQSCWTRRAAFPSGTAQNDTDDTVLASFKNLLFDFLIDCCTNERKTNDLMEIIVKKIHPKFYNTTTSQCTLLHAISYKQ